MPKSASIKLEKFWRRITTMKTIRKIFLTAIALLTMASMQVFGMYGVDSDWIDFLTDGNQFKARLETLGFTLGNDTIKGTFGFDNGAGGTLGALISQNANPDWYDFIPHTSFGIAYTSSSISVGVGYTLSIGQKFPKYNGSANPKTTVATGHTPVLVLNALDNNFRMAIPIQAVSINDKTAEGVKQNLTAVKLNSEFRYYTGMDILTQVRLYLNYGYNSIKNGDLKSKYETLGFDFRLYFGAMVEDVELEPFIKIAYNTGLDKNLPSANLNFDVIEEGKASDIVGEFQYAGQSFYGTNSFDKTAWSLELMPALGLSASSDIVSLYLEPALGLEIIGSQYNNQKDTYSLAWNVYGEISITPIQNLEWYFEAELGDNADETSKVLNFNATTGITWYLPAL